METVTDQEWYAQLQSKASMTQIALLSCSIRAQPNKKQK
jgi:hypothetical protein